MEKPYIINFPKIGDSAQGYISIAENENLPFEVKRIYWTYFTPESVQRGGHAHYQLQQILVAVSGSITIDIELSDGTKNNYILSKPNEGLYIPKMSWRNMQYSHNAVQMCIASMVYEEEDYIRNYELFREKCR